MLIFLCIFFQIVQSQFFQSFCPSFLATGAGVFLAYYINRQIKLNREKKEKKSYLRLLLDSYETNLKIIRQWEKSLSEKGPYVLNVYLYEYESTGFFKYQLISDRDLLKQMVDTYIQLKMMQKKLDLQFDVTDKKRREIYSSMKENIDFLTKEIPIIIIKLNYEIEKIDKV